MKRNAGGEENGDSSKKTPRLTKKAGKGKEKLKGYCDVEMRVDEQGGVVWPAPRHQMDEARRFLRECATAQRPTLIVPDKDADGLSAGVIIHRSLIALGLNSNNLSEHLVQKGNTIHDEVERESMLVKNPAFVIVVDQGSRAGPPVIDSANAKCLVIDHHLSDVFPKDAVIVNGCHYPPVATSSLLAYEICKELDPRIANACGYLCAIGTYGDLGNLPWISPFPDMTETFKRHAKKLIHDCVSLINAPRRTGTYDVHTAWTALVNDDPKQILSNPRLIAAKQEIAGEVAGHARTPPKFSKDGKIAVFRIHSAAQIHPLIATRWANTLKSNKLEFVLCANSGYLPDKINFSCRIARCALSREGAPPVNIIELLKEAAGRDEGDLMVRLGESFARGHKGASGGIVPVKEFEELMALMQIGEQPDAAWGGGKSKRGKGSDVAPKNTLENYFRKV